MNVETTAASGTTVVRVDGEVDMNSAPALREALRTAIDGGATTLRVHLGGVTYMDSAGVGELVASYTTASNREADLKLINLTSKIRDLLQFTQLISVFEHFSEESEGVASFSE